jgi:hypothetical protein
MAAHGSLQWQGTDACIDLYCYCGHTGHFDGFFLFVYKCSACGTFYNVSNVVALHKIESPTVEDAETAKTENTEML